MTDHERTSPSSSARTIAPAATPMKRLRWLAYELAFCAISVVGRRRRRVGEVRGESGRGRWRAGGPGCGVASALVRRAADGGLDDPLHHRREPLALRADLAKDDAGPRREARSRGSRRWVSGPIRTSAFATAWSIATSLASAADRDDPGVDLEEVRPGILDEEQAECLRVALELAVREGSLLERSEPRRSVVRLAEDTQPEQADGDDEHGGADERDEQLRVDLGRQAADPADESVVARVRQPSLCRPEPLAPAVAEPRTRPQRTERRGRSRQARDQPASVDPRNVAVGGRDRHDLARLGVDVVALEVQRAPVAVDGDADLVRGRLGDPGVRRLERLRLREPELPDLLLPHSGRPGERERRVRGVEAHHQVDVLLRRGLVEVLLELVDLPEIGVSPHLLLRGRARARAPEAASAPTRTPLRPRSHCGSDDELSHAREPPSARLAGSRYVTMITCWRGSVQSLAATVEDRHARVPTVLAGRSSGVLAHLSADARDPVPARRQRHLDGLLAADAALEASDDDGELIRPRLEPDDHATQAAARRSSSLQSRRRSASPSVRSSARVDAIRGTDDDPAGQPRARAQARRRRPPLECAAGRDQGTGSTTTTPAAASATTLAAGRAGSTARALRAAAARRRRCASAASTATLAQNSVGEGATRSAASSATETPNTIRCLFPAGTVFGSVSMKKRKTRISGENARIGPEVEALDGAEVPPRGHRMPRRRDHGHRGRRTRARTRAPSRAAGGARGSRSRPTTMIASASARAGDIGPHQKSSGSARPGPAARKQRTSPKFDGLKTWAPRKRITYFERSDTAAVPAKIHQPLSAPPVPVLRARHAEDERDAVAGEERARRPDEHALPPQDDGDFEHRARPDRDQDLRDREPEVERDLTEDLQGDDHGGEVQAGVAHAGQHHRVARASDRDSAGLGR